MNRSIYLLPFAACVEKKYPGNSKDTLIVTLNQKCKDAKPIIIDYGHHLGLNNYCKYAYNN